MSKFKNGDRFTLTQEACDAVYDFKEIRLTPDDIGIVIEKAKLFSNAYFVVFPSAKTRILSVFDEEEVIVPEHRMSAWKAKCAL